MTAAGQGLGVVQSVLNFEYWSEIVDGFDHQGQQLLQSG